MLRLLILLISALLPLLAQSVVEGVVVESVAKSPVTGATVQVIWTKPLKGDALIHGLNDIGPKATSDDAGHFRIEVPTPSEFTFKVTKEGFSSLEGKAAGAFTLKDRESKRDIALTLQQECMIEGRVWDPDLESPVAGLPVVAHGTFSPRPGYSVFGPSKRTTTDKDGKYKLEGLRPGKYRVVMGPSARATLHEVRQAAQQPTIYGQVFYPGVSDEAAAVEIDLLPGARAGSIDVRMNRSAAYRVRGRIERADGRPLVGLVACGSSAKYGPRGMGHRPLGNLKNMSVFELEPVEPGTFALYCTNDSETRKDRLIGIAAVTVEDKDVDGLIVTLKAGVSVTGIVRTEDVEPGKLDPVWNVVQKEITVGLRRATRNMYSDEWPVPVERDSGKWMIEGIHEELHNVEVIGLPTGYAVTSMEYNGSPITLGRFEPNPTAIAHNVKINVATVSNSVRGVVMHDDKPLVDALVLMVREPVPEDQFIWQTKAKISGGNGEYTFDTLEPGWYRVGATAPGPGSDNDLFGRLASGDCKRIEITKTTNTTLNLSVP